MVSMNGKRVNLKEVGGSLYDTPRIASVQIDLKAVLGIIQAEQEKVSDEGYIFGTHIGSTLEITYHCPLPPERMRKEYETDKQREIAAREHLIEKQAFQTDFSDSLKLSRMDSKVVGWYFISWPDAATTKDVIEAQLAFEKEQGDFILIAYDPWKSASGKLNLQALRLSPKCREVLDGSAGTLETLNLLSHKVYEEIPLSVRIPLLDQLFLQDTEFSHGGAQESHVYAAENESELYLRRQINNLSNSLDALQLDVSDFVGMRPSRRFVKDNRELKHESKKNSFLHGQILQEDNSFLHNLVKEMADNVSLLKDLSLSDKSEVL